MRSRHLLLSTLLASLLPATISAQPARDLAGTGRSAAQPANVTRLIVKLKSRPAGAIVAASMTDDGLASLSRAAGVKLRLQRTMSGGASILQLPEATTPAEARSIAQRLQDSAQVAYAVPDYRRHISALPNDPGYGEQWGLFTPASTLNAVTTTGGINIPTAWDITTGSNATVIAVLDTGVLPHTDIVGQLLPGYDFISNSFVANDGDGRDNNPVDSGDWVSSADQAEPECAGDIVENSSWHGTFVSGIVAAMGNNSVGVSGVNWGSRILPVRVLGKCGGSDSDIIDAMRWAAGLPVSDMASNPNPADVINLSLGGFSECTLAFQEAINEIHAAGVTIVAATGNDGLGTVSSPANCPHVIAVSAHSIEGIITYYSNIGPETALSAPGGGFAISTEGLLTGSGLLIYSLSNTGTTTSVSDSYSLAQGTSFSTPYVAGVAALIRTLAPSMPPDTVRAFLVGTTRAHPAGSVCTLAILQGKCGSGLLDATMALQAVAAALNGNQSPVATAPSQLTGTEGTPLNFQISGTDANGDSLIYTAVAGSLPDTAVIDEKTGLFTWARPVAGSYSVQVTVSDGLSTSAPQTVTMTIRSIISAVPALSNASSESKGGGSPDLFLMLLAGTGLLLRTRRR